MTVGDLRALISGCNDDAEVVIVAHEDIVNYETAENGARSLTVAAVAIGEHSDTLEPELILFSGVEVE